MFILIRDLEGDFVVGFIWDELKIYYGLDDFVMVIVIMKDSKVIFMYGFFEKNSLVLSKLLNDFVSVLLFYCKKYIDSVYGIYWIVKVYFEL